MKRTFVRIILLIVLGLASATPATAAEADAAGMLSVHTPVIQDTRADHLKAYLASHNSPLAEHAGIFVREADKHDLDWRLVAAIAGLESSFGKHIPAGSHNAWGWGIPTGAQSGIGFASWEDGIGTVSEGLRERYINKGATTIDQMGRIYAASPTWAIRVKFFIEKITTFEPRGVDTLAITL